MTEPIDDHDLPMWPTVVAWCKRPIGRQSAFQSGVQGKPFVDPRDLKRAFIMVPDAPGLILQLVPRFSRWPSIGQLALMDAYRVGRTLRGIAHALDVLRLPEEGAMAVFETLVAAAIEHPTNYSNHVLLVDFVSELTRSHGQERIVDLASRIQAYALRTPHPMEYDQL